MPSIKKLIVFDLDGTLYKTETSFIPAVRKFVRHYNRPTPSEQVLYSFIGEPEEVFEKWIEEMAIDIETELLLKEFDRIELVEIRRRGCLYDSVVETLTWLKTRDYVLALCSNGPGWYIDEVLTGFGIDQLFELRRGPLSSEDTKDRMLKEIFNNVKPSSSIMVGDRYHDLLAARRCGFTFIGASYGYGGDEIIQADYLIQALPELKELLKR